MASQARSILPQPVGILGILHRDDATFHMLEFELDSKISIGTVSRTGRLLRLRIQPPLNEIASATISELNGLFQKFSHYRTSRFSELLFFGKGKIGQPTVLATQAGRYKLSIPFRLQESDFPLTGGEEIGQGLTYFRDRIPTGAGNCDIYLLKLDTMAGAHHVLPVLANEGICQKEVLSSLGKRYNATAGINGAYFTAKGDPVGTLIIDRRIISSPVFNRSVFGISHAGKPLFGNPEFEGTLHSDRGDVTIDAVNQPRGTDQLVIYTPEFGRSTMTEGFGTEIVLLKGKVVGIHRHDAVIPPDGVVVSAIGRKARELSEIRLGDAVRLDYRVSAPWDSVIHAVCGGPRLLRDGALSINGREEKFDSSIFQGRHPRTAVALTENGDLLFLVADGRTSRSAGLTLKELATYLRRLGGFNAINLDGGGSSSMFVKGRIVNHPSDGKERRISNGILITCND